MSATDTHPALSRSDSKPASKHGRTMSAVLAIACVASMTALPAQALQLVEASDGAAVEAILSIREPTRIRIEGASITDVFGNIHSSQCGLAAALPTSPGMTPAGSRFIADQSGRRDRPDLRPRQGRNLCPSGW
jgi:conjugal transfer pilus assembly protein TraK